MHPVLVQVVDLAGGGGHFAHDAGAVLHLQGDTLVAEQHEVVDQDLGSFLQRAFRIDAAVRGQLDGELLVVRLLFHAGVVHAVLHVLDGCEDGIDEDGTDGRALHFVLLGGHIAAALADGEFHVQLHVVLHAADHELRVQHLETGGVLADVGGGEAVLTANSEVEFLVVHVLKLAAEAYLLEVEHDLGDILDDALDGAELMLDTVDAQAGDGEAFQAAEQDAAEGVADGDAIAGLQWTELENSVLVVGFDHRDLVRPLEI